MDLSIIIVNYKSRDKTLDCLGSIGASIWEGLSYEVLVINNSDEDLADVTAKYPHTRYLGCVGNIGMGAGNNIGLKAAQGEDILILNPDTVLQPGALRLLYDYLRAHPEVGVVGPRLQYPGGEFQESARKFPSFLMPFIRRTFLGKIIKEKESEADIRMKQCGLGGICEPDWIMGSCLLFRGGLFRKFGGFDKRYFMYFEDIDICRQVWTAGYKVVYLPQALVVHNHGQHSARTFWLIAPFTDKYARIHIYSWLKYSWKWKGGGMNCE